MDSDSLFSILSNSIFSTAGIFSIILRSGIMNEQRPISVLSNSLRQFDQFSWCTVFSLFVPNDLRSWKSGCSASQIKCFWFKDWCIGWGFSQSGRLCERNILVIIINKCFFRKAYRRNSNKPPNTIKPLHLSQNYK